MPISTRVTQNVASFQSRATIVAGSVAIGATGAVGAKTGRGFTVTRTGVGLYTITIDGVGALPILYALASVVFTTAHVAAINTIVPASRTITITTATAALPGTPADPTSGATLQVFAVVNNMPIGQN